MNYLEMRSQKINEGLFKEVEKTIIDQDDPDYVEKDRERMFNNFKDADEHRKRIPLIDWICDHVYLSNSIVNGSGKTMESRYLAATDEGRYFRINDDYSIDLFSVDYPSELYGNDSPIMFTIQSNKVKSKESVPLFNEAGELPYKIRVCMGHFKLDETYFAEDDTDIMKSFKNIPSTVIGDCYIATYRTVIPLSTCPPNMSVTNELYLNCIDSMQGMPCIKADRLRIGCNHTTCYPGKSIADFKGWHAQSEIDDIMVMSNNTFRSLRGLPDGFTCKRINLDYCSVEEIRDWPKNLNVGLLDLTDNMLSHQSLTFSPLPSDLKANVVIIGKQFDITQGCIKPESWSMSSKSCLIKKSKKTPILIPPGVKEFYIWNIPYDANGSKFSSDTLYTWAGFNPVNLKNGEVSTGKNTGYWKYMDESDMNRLNEGLFKKIEQTIIDQDDPDYIRKDRERMFNNLVDAETRKKNFAAVSDWIASFVAVFLTGNFKKTFFLTQDYEGKYYEIENPDGTYTNPIINIIGPVERCWICSSKDGRSPFNEKGELPYKFGSCSGDFSILRFPYNPFDNYGRPITGIDGTISGSTLRSFKNIPNLIEGCLSIEDLTVKIGSDSSDIAIPGQYYIQDFSDFPNNIVINSNTILGKQGGYGLTLQGIAGLKNFSGINGLYIKNGRLKLQNCKNFTDFEGWNDSINLDGLNLDSPNKNIRVEGCYEFESLRGLPDGFNNPNLELRILHCYKFNKIIDWPKQIHIGYIDLSDNGLTTKSLCEYPLPYDLKSGWITLGVKKSKNYSVPIPPGVKNFAFCLNSGKGGFHKEGEPENSPYWHYMKNPEEFVNKQINEGFFKEIEQTFIDQDDPDYIRKDRERMFNNFKQSDLNRKKSVIEDWIYENIRINPNSAQPYWGAGSSGAYRNLEPADKGKYFYVDDEYKIHLMCPTDSMMPCFKLSNGVTSIDSIPYEIEECQGDFDASHTGITSLKNFPKTLGKPASPELYWATVKTDKNDNWVYGRLKVMYCYSLASLAGCPQKGVRSVDCYKCSLNSLEGLPPTIAGYIDAKDNYLTSLDYCPRVTVQDSRSDFQGNYIPAADIRSAADKLHWTKDDVLDQISTQRKG